jgi:hypothetical protein
MIRDQRERDLHRPAARYSRSLMTLGHASASTQMCIICVAVPFALYLPTARTSLRLVEYAAVLRLAERLIIIDM